MKVTWLSTCLLFICIYACTPASKTDQAVVHEDFKPKGDESDLVYNPIRSDGSIDSSFLPIIQFTSQEFDYGEINEGDIVEHDYEFKNIGTAPLLIVEVNTTCGCTVPEWSKDPVAPGATGSVRVKFDSTNKEGLQNKEVSIFANTIPNKTVLTIKGIVAKT